MLPDSARLVVLGCNHHRTPLSVRERMALEAHALENLRKRLRQHPDLAESLVLHTCNRIEVYAVTANPFQWPEQLAGLLQDQSGFPASEFLRHAYTYQDQDALQHAFHVASGLDSQMVGETQILGQLKEAYRDAVDRGSVGPCLHRLFQKTFQAAKWARSETAISSGQVSLGNVAVQLANRIFGRLDNSHCMVVGSGEVGREVAHAFRNRGVAGISVASRTSERAQSLAHDIDAEVIPFTTWTDALPDVDIAIFATSAPAPILLPQTIEHAHAQRRYRPVFLIDLAVPRDVHPDLATLDYCFLYNLEDLAAIANENLAARQQEVSLCRQHLADRAHRIWQAFSNP